MFRPTNPPTGNGYFGYYLIDDSAVYVLRKFLSQLLETALEESSAPMIISLSQSEFDALATAYHDLLIGYRHPRQDSMAFRFRQNDATLAKLKEIFPKWKTCDDMPPKALINYRNLSK